MAYTEFQLILETTLNALKKTLRNPCDPEWLKNVGVPFQLNI